jgi:hypothetical protein
MPWLGHDRFLPNPFQFVNHQSSYHFGSVLSELLSLCLSLSPHGSTTLLELGCFFSFLIYTQSVGLLGRGISPSQVRYLHTGQHKHRIIAHTGIHASSEIQRTNPVFQQAKTVHALDRAATVARKYDPIGANVAGLKVKPAWNVPWTFVYNIALCLQWAVCSDYTHQRSKSPRNQNYIYHFMTQW